MLEPLPASDFADLARRCLDGTASEADQSRLGALLVADEKCAREFASLSRFEALLRQECTREMKTLLEFVALESECDEMPARRAALPAREAPAQTRRFTGFPAWMRIAAIFMVMAGIIALFLNLEDRSALRGTVASGPQTTIMRDGKKALLQPRSSPVAPPKELIASVMADDVGAQSMAQRLNDFYLPSVSFEGVPAGEAMKTLSGKLQEYNFARRPDFEKMSVSVPPSASSRPVTMKSGPISFAKAVEVVSALAQCDAKVTGAGMEITDASESNAASAASWSPMMAGFASAAQVQQEAAALGIALADSSIRYDGTTHAASVNATASQQSALSKLLSARLQLASLAPLKFVPLVIPSGTAGGERVLTSAEVAQVREQLASAPAGSLPVITLPFSSEKPTVFNSSTGDTISINVAPLGEMNSVTVDTGNSSNLAGGTQDTTVASAVTTASNQIDANGNPVTSSVGANASSATTASTTTGATSTQTTGVQAVIDADQGLIADVSDEEEQLYTADGLPIPRGAVYVSGDASSASTGTSLLFVPVNP